MENIKWLDCQTTCPSKVNSTDDFEINSSKMLVWVLDEESGYEQAMFAIYNFFTKSWLLAQNRRFKTKITHYAEINSPIH